MAKVVNLTAAASAHVSASAGWALTRGSTGRTTECFQTEQFDDERLVAEWARADSIEAMLVHPGAARFSELLRLPSELARGTIRAFRGRAKKDIVGEPTPTHFGPPPAAATRVFRYNEERCPVLYIASTPEGVWAELNHRVHRPLWCQEYSVDVTRIRILDASRPELHNFLQLAWDAAERPNLPEYQFSRTLAKLVRAEGFDGMLVPGIRGKPESRYCNLVVFNPEPGWHGWLAPGCTPFAMDLSSSVTRGNRDPGDDDDLSHIALEKPVP